MPLRINLTAMGMSTLCKTHRDRISSSYFAVNIGAMKWLHLALALLSLTLTRAQESTEGGEDISDGSEEGIGLRYLLTPGVQFPPQPIPGGTNGYISLWQAMYSGQPYVLGWWGVPAQQPAPAPAPAPAPVVRQDPPTPPPAPAPAPARPRPSPLDDFRDRLPPSPPGIPF